MSLEVFKTRFLPAKSKLFRYAVFFLKNRDEALDVVQDVYLKVWKMQDQWENVLNAEAWCMTLTRNMAFDRLKSFEKKNESLDAAMWVISDHSPYSTAEEKDSWRHMTSLLGKLSEPQQEAIKLRDMEGFSYEEIADIMQTELSQVKIHLHRGRKFLKEHFLKINAYGL